MNERTTIANTQPLTPEQVDALTARAHRLRDEYIAQGARRLLAAARRRLRALGTAPEGRLAGSH